MLQYFDTLTDDSGNTLLGATLQVTVFPGGALANIYNTNGTTSPIANSTVSADITGQVNFFIPDGSYIFTYTYKGTQYKIRSPVQLEDPTAFLAMTDTGAANAYAVTDQRLSANLYAGLKIEFKAAHTNTGASTLNFQGLGTQSIVLPGGNALLGGMIQTNGLTRVEYDGTVWQLVGAQSQPFYPQTQAEQTNGVTPTVPSFPFGDLRRYGAVGGPFGSVPSTDDSAAWATAVSTGYINLPAGIAFKIVTGASYTGQMVVQGNGPTSQVYCDGTILTLSGGSFSQIGNFYCGNITAPLTIQRYVETTVNTTATTVAGNAAITVASATGIRKGMVCTGPNVWQRALVVSVSGVTVTLSQPAQTSGSNSAVQFFDVTWNQGASALATAAQTDTEGRYSPNVNDSDVWSSLSGAQQAAAQIGPVISLAGNHIDVSRMYGKRLSILFNNSSQCTARDCEFQGGWTWAGIAFLNSTATRTKNNRAIGNRIWDHGFNGILFMGCDGCTISDNVLHGIGESGVKTYQGSGQTGYFDGCSAINSSNNRAYACYQGSFDYQSTSGATEGYNTSISNAIGDQASWCMQGMSYSGSGWNIDFACEFIGGNLGPPNLIQVSDSNVRMMIRESNIIPVMSPYNVAAVIGDRNRVTGRVYQETTRNTGYQLYVSTLTSGQRTRLEFFDCTDAVSSSGSQILYSQSNGGIIDRFDVRTNGATDLPAGAGQIVTPTFGATVTIDLSLGDTFYINATSNIAFTVSNPTNGPTARNRIFLTIANTSGGALGAITFGTGYKLTTGSPANNMQRTWVLRNNSAGNYYQEGGAPVDVAN